MKITLINNQEYYTSNLISLYNKYFTIKNR